METDEAFFPYRPVGADHSHEGLERSYLLVASVGFEVVHLDILLLEVLALDVFSVLVLGV